MKFTYCIGNPPYQGESYNEQLWPNFVLNATNISNRACLIHPGKWVVPKTSFIKHRDNLIASGLKRFYYYLDSHDPFPTLRGIDGGVTITYFEPNYKNTITFMVHGKDKSQIYDITKPITLTDCETEIYNKLLSKFDLVKSNMSYRKLGVTTLGGAEFGYDKWDHLDHVIKHNPEELDYPINVYTNDKLKKKTGKYIWGYIDKSFLNKQPDKLFSSRKIMISKLTSNENGHINGFSKMPIICDKYTITQNHYFIYPEHDTFKELKLIKSLFLTKTVRYLMGLTEKGLCTAGFENIPDYLELAKLLPDDQLFTDEWFYKTFDFSQELINEIESRVSEKIDTPMTNLDYLKYTICELYPEIYRDLISYEDDSTSILFNKPDISTLIKVVDLVDIGSNPQNHFSAHTKAELTTIIINHIIENIIIKNSYKEFKNLDLIISNIAYNLGENEISAILNTISLPTNQFRYIYAQFMLKNGQSILIKIQ